MVGMGVGYKGAGAAKGGIEPQVRLGKINAALK
jgi:hypothetical protein